MVASGACAHEVVVERGGLLLLFAEDIPNDNVRYGVEDFNGFEGFES